MLFLTFLFGLMVLTAAFYCLFILRDTLIGVICQIKAFKEQDINFTWE